MKNWLTSRPAVIGGWMVWVAYWSWRDWRRRLVWAAPLAVAAALVMGEISQLLQTLAATTDHFTYSANALTGWPGWTPWDGTDRERAMTAWTAWADAVPGETRATTLHTWLIAHLLLDMIVFTPGYVISLCLFLRWLHDLRSAQQTPGWSARIPFGPTGIALLVFAVLVADWAETGLTFGLVHAGEGSIGAWADAVACLSLVKWVLLAVVVGLGAAVFLVDILPRVLTDWLERWVEGTPSASRCWTRHRVQLVALAVLAALIALPGGGPLEQVPDIQRAWVDANVSDGWWASVRDYAGDMAGPVLTLVGLCAALWVAGRWALLDGLGVTRHPARTRRRFGALVLGAVFVVLLVRPVWLWRGPWGHNAGGLAIPSVLLGIFLLGFFVAGNGTQDVQPPAAREKTERLGRALTVVPLVIAGLGLVRAFVKPVLLEPLVDTGVSQCALWTWLVGGLTLALVLPPLVFWILGKAETRLFQSVNLRKILPIAVGAPLLVIACVLGVFTAVDPLTWGARLRTLGVLSLLLTTVVLVGALFVRQTEKREPYGAFRTLRFRFTPIWLPVVAVLATQSALDNSGLYHAVRQVDQAPRAAAFEHTPSPIKPASDQWPFPKQQFEDWYKQAAACWKVQKNEAIPMVLVAAAGGGIRAAYWTSSAMDRLAGASTCAGSSAFALSGVSGGSLGLAAYTLTGGRPWGPVKAQDGSHVVQKLAGEDALAADIAALLYRDGTHAFHGLNYLFNRTVGDRAAIFERAWEGTWEGWKRELGSATRQAPHWRPFLLMNGTDVVTGCRIAVAAHPLTGTARADERLRCQKPTIAANGDQLATATVDASAFNDTADCKKEDMDQALRMSTAAHLSARFTYVSPSGTMYGCTNAKQEDPPAISSIDGGYLEGSGMAALLELWSAVQPEVALHNRCVTANRETKTAKSQKKDPCLMADGEKRTAYVAPLVVLLDNHYSVQAPEPDINPVNELVAPLTGNRARATAARTATLQQAALVRFTGPLPGMAQAAPPVRSFLVAPRTEPQIAAPLGWVLSEMSMRSMRTQLEGGVKTPDEAPGNPSGKRLGARQLPDLIQTLQRPVKLPATPS